MFSSKTQEIFKEQLASLPQNVIDALESVDIPSAIQQVTTKNGLRTDESALYEQELVLVLMGITNSKAFVDNLVREGGFKQELANSLANDSNKNIFIPVRTALYENNEKEALNNAVVENLKEISLQDIPVAAGTTPPPVHPPASDLPTTPTAVQTKLEQPFRLAPDTVVIKKPALSSPIEKGAYPKGSDPYREPIN